MTCPDALETPLSPPYPQWSAPSAPCAVKAHNHSHFQETPPPRVCAVCATPLVRPRGKTGVKNARNWGKWNWNWGKPGWNTWAFRSGHSPGEKFSRPDLITRAAARGRGGSSIFYVSILGPPNICLTCQADHWKKYRIDIKNGVSGAIRVVLVRRAALDGYLLRCRSACGV